MVFVNSSSFSDPFNKNGGRDIFKKKKSNLLRNMVLTIPIGLSGYYGFVNYDDNLDFNSNVSSVYKQVLDYDFKTNFNTDFNLTSILDSNFDFSLSLRNLFFDNGSFGLVGDNIDGLGESVESSDVNTLNEIDSSYILSKKLINLTLFNNLFPNLSGDLITDLVQNYSNNFNSDSNLDKSDSFFPYLDSSSKLFFESSVDLTLKTNLISNNDIIKSEKIVKFKEPLESVEVLKSVNVVRPVLKTYNICVENPHSIENGILGGPLAQNGLESVLNAGFESKYGKLTECNFTHNWNESMDNLLLDMKNLSLISLNNYKNLSNKSRQIYDIFQ